MFRTRRRGFTMLEICLVVVIMGFLAALGMREYINHIERMRSSEAIDVLTKCYMGYTRYLSEGYVINSANPLTWRRLGIEPPTMANRYFSYAIRPLTTAPTFINATRIGVVGRWLTIDLATGRINKTYPY